MSFPTNQIGRLDEMPDVSVDACVIDHTGRLVFLSLWGRDTATSELLARLTLPRHEPESLVSGITLSLDGDRQVLSVNTELLEKHFSRTFGRTKFGSINNLWLFDSRAVSPDKANLTALVFLQGEVNGSIENHPEYGKVMAQLVNLSPVPILPEWASAVASECMQLDMIHVHKTLLGKIVCVEIALEQDVLERRMSQMIQTGLLCVPA